MHGRQEHRVTIVGGGIAGLTCAILLARRALSVNVFERRPDLRGTEIPRGRSINFTLSQRGARVLKQIHLLQKTQEKAIPLTGRIIHARNRRSFFQPYGNTPSEILYAVNRNELIKTLLNAAHSHSNIQLFFETQCIGIDQPSAHAQFLHHSQKIQVSSDFILGCDGAYSVVRSFMHRGERANFSQEYSEWGYKELIISPPAAQRLNLNALHLWPRGDSVLCGIPNPDGSLICTLIMKFHGPTGFESIRTTDQIIDFFDKRFLDALILMPDAAQQFLAAPANAMITTQTSHWHYRDKIAILGDAAHAVSPFIGQGMNSALEDSATLDHWLTQYPDHREEAFLKFALQRRPEAQALARLSQCHLNNLKENFGSPWHLAKAQTELLLNRFFPSLWKPLYTLIAHTSQPYSRAIQRSELQEKVYSFLGLICLQLALFCRLLLSHSRPTCGKESQP